MSFLPQPVKFLHQLEAEVTPFKVHPLLLTLRNVIFFQGFRIIRIPKQKNSIKDITGLLGYYFLIN